jgi:hypothetical protein
MRRRRFTSFRTAIRAGHVQPSFAQLGEDGVLWWLFHDRLNGFYVDIGCHHPHRFSNTARLHHCNGWSGLNVDIDAGAIAAFQVERPNDINLCMGVAGVAGMRDATFFHEGAVNSLVPGAAQDPHWAALLKETRRVEVQPLSQILLQNLPTDRRIDFLNIDAEGLDFEVLNSNDWAKFQPEVVAIESHGFDLAEPRNDATYRLLTEIGYKLLAHVVVTSIYRRAA